MNEPHHEASRKADKLSFEIRKKYTPLHLKKNPHLIHEAIKAHQAAFDAHTDAMQKHMNYGKNNETTARRVNYHQDEGEYHRGESAHLQSLLKNSQHSEQQDGYGYHVTPERAEELLATSAVFQGAKR